MSSRRAAILLIVGVVLLLVAAIGWWQFARPALFPGPTPPPAPTVTPSPTFAAPPANFTPPPSLDELATQFPELGSVLLNSELSSVYKDFVVAYQTGGIEAARQLATERGLLDDQDRVRLTIELDTTDTASLEQQLEDNGVQVLQTYQNLMDVAIPLRVIEAAASQENPGADFDQITQLDHVVRIRLPLPAESNDDPVPGEGVKVSGAELWHQAGITGRGVRVGILDLGFRNYTSLLGRGLPQNVVAKSFVPGIEPEESDEIHGAAVAEIVYEMAPDAELFLAYYDGDDVSFGNAVDWLVSQNVQIISHSAGGVVGPMDGSDSDAAIVDSIAAQGILWVNSAGNEADAHYRGTFTDTDGNGCHEFPDGSEAMGVMAGPSGVGVFVNWDDWGTPTQDYDLYVLDQDGNLLASSEDYQDGQAGQWPVEVVVNRGIAPETVVYARICAARADRAVTFDVYTQGYAIEFPVADHSLVTPGDARGSFTIGAINWDTSELAVYSSQGPTNDGRQKPDISGPTGVSSESYSPDVFNGTSASAPYVSGAAALVWSAHPEFSADEVKNYLMSSSIDMFTPGPDSIVGAGYLRLPPPEGVAEATVTASAATEVAFLDTAVPEPRPRPGDSGGGGGGGATTALLLGLACGGFFLCGFGLVVVGGVALFVARGRRSSAPPPPPVPIVPGAPAPMSPPPTDPVPPPLVMPTAAVPRDATTPAIEMGRATLVSASGKVYNLKPEGSTLGRAPECEIVLDTTQVSRRHATLKLEGVAWAVRDLGSSNGTFLNGERLEPNVNYRLSTGDDVVFGGRAGEKMTFRQEA